MHEDSLHCGGWRVPLSHPRLDPETVEQGRAAMRQEQAPEIYLDKLERQMASWLKRPAVAVASASAGLLLALRAAGVRPGDAVLVPAFNFAGAAYPILQLGAEPVWIDSELSTGNLELHLVHKWLRENSAGRSRPRACLMVHVYGQPADAASLRLLCDNHGVVLIEDVAEAAGAYCAGRPCGSFGHFSVFSFNCNKIVTGLGGGMVLGEDPAAMERIRAWANQGRQPGAEGQPVREVGGNYRMSHLMAAVASAELSRIEERIAARRAVFEFYRQKFEEANAGRPLGGALQGNYWLSCFRMPGRSSEAVVRQLRKAGIEARAVWRPLHWEPLFASYPFVGSDVAGVLYANGICLPSSHWLSEEAQAEVIDHVLQLAAE